jgi:hypothetical protein
MAAAAAVAVSVQTHQQLRQEAEEEQEQEDEAMQTGGQEASLLEMAGRGALVARQLESLGASVAPHPPPLLLLLALLLRALPLALLEQGWAAGFQMMQRLLAHWRAWAVHCLEGQGALLRVEAAWAVRCQAAVVRGERKAGVAAGSQGSATTRALSPATQQLPQGRCY